MTLPAHDGPYDGSEPVTGNATRVKQLSRVAALCAALLWFGAPAPASADEGDAEPTGFWANRLTLTLGSGPTLPTWEGMKVMTGGRFTASYGMAPLLEGRIAFELISGAWVILQNEQGGGWSGPTVIYVLPGARARLFDGPFTPFAAGHLGLTINRAAYIDNGVNLPGFGLDLTVGVEWVPFGWLDLEAFVAYNLSAPVPVPRDGNNLGAGSFFVVGASLGVAIPVR